MTSTNAFLPLTPWDNGDAIAALGSPVRLSIPLDGIEVSKVGLDIDKGAKHPGGI